MKLKFYQLDAFTDKIFGGNYAGVIIRDQWLGDDLMQNIAMENNVSETAFVVHNGDENVDIRWFSPLAEIDFCGHATLAAAQVLFNENPDSTRWTFNTKTVGSLDVEQYADGLIAMSFPHRPPELINDIPEALLRGLSIQPKEILRSPQAWFAIYENAQQIEDLESNSALLAQLAPYDVVATAPRNNEFDFVSRYFWPANGGDEDPVTGSIHAGLAPFWAARLNKNTLRAFQASNRGGVLGCQVTNDKVIITGRAITYLEGTITVD